MNRVNNAMTSRSDGLGKKGGGQGIASHIDLQTEVVSKSCGGIFRHLGFTALSSFMRHSKRRRAQKGEVLYAQVRAAV